MDFKNWTSKRAQVGSVNLHYRTAGEGPVVVLLHGFPQHSLMWHKIGPILAQKFTVIALDQRGAGMSSITTDGYDGTTMAADLNGLLDAIGVGSAFVAGYDLGTRTAAAFARDYPERCERVAFMEFALPSFGYEQNMAPTKDWSLNSNWHLSLFTVPEAAEFLIRGKEREMLSWWFYHIAYSGNVRMSAEHFEANAREISKPGALRAGILYYAAVWKDAEDFAILHEKPLSMPALAMAGEASIAPYLDQAWKGVGVDVTTKVIPEAGHWIGDENPKFVGEALLEFFSA